MINQFLVFSFGIKLNKQNKTCEKEDVKELERKSLFKFEGLIDVFITLDLFLIC